MKNNRGFTLIELIATITILGIIMLVAIPNIMSTSIKSKNRTYLNDANKLVALTKYRFESDPNINKPTKDDTNDEDDCLIIYLNDLDQTELQKGPEGGEYDKNLSFVIIRYDEDNYKYQYYVQIKEKYGEHGKGIEISKYEDILEGQDKNSLIKTPTSWATNLNNTDLCDSYHNINNEQL